MATAAAQAAFIVETPYSVRVATRFNSLADSSKDVQQVSDAIVAVLRDIDAALSPIIGRQSFLALLNRSVALADASYPWPGIRHEAAAVETTLTALGTALARHNPAGAAAIGATLVATVHGSLTALIGHSLTERLLHNVRWISQDGSL